MFYVSFLKRSLIFALFILECVCMYIVKNRETLLLYKRTNEESESSLLRHAFL